MTMPRRRIAPPSEQELLAYLNAVPPPPPLRIDLTPQAAKMIERLFGGLFSLAFALAGLLLTFGGGRLLIVLVGVMLSCVGLRGIEAAFTGKWPDEDD
jgi:hypothetical protein